MSTTLQQNTIEAAEGGSLPCRRMALVISSLGPGGAERVMSRLANHWAAQGQEIVLVTLQPNTPDHFALDPSIRRVSLRSASPSGGPFRALENNRRHLRLLRDTLREAAPDVIISFGDAINVLTLIAARPLRVPVLVSERTNPTRPGMRRAWSMLRRVVYPSAAGLVVQSRAVAAWARGVVPTSKIHLIPNPVRVEPTPDDAPPALASLIDERAIVAVGRMSPEKGFDLLIDAFARVHAGRPEWRLVILGEGTERPRLEAQIKRLGLRAAVELPGTVPDPVEAFRRAGIFALSSRIEGFPNALLEAMAAGLPVVAADCPYGPAEIVQDEWNGMLVPVGNADALATGLLRLIDDPELRARLGARATSVAEAYSPEKIMGSWNRVVADACARRPRAPVPGGQR